MGPTVSDGASLGGEAWQGGVGAGRGPQARTPARPACVSPGAVRNASSLLTYDSRVLVNNFLYGPKHDPTFQPLFLEEMPPSPSQAPEVGELCGGDSFCSFDVAATGSLSVGNATRAAHQLHQRHVQSLKPGEAGRALGGGQAPCRGTGPPCGSRLSLAPCLHASGVLRLAGPTPQWAKGWHQLPDGLHCLLPLQQRLQPGGGRGQPLPGRRHLV